MTRTELVRRAANEESYLLPGFQIRAEQAVILFNANLESPAAPLHAKIEALPADRQMRIERQCAAMQREQESLRLQYALRQQASDLGWEETNVEVVPTQAPGGLGPLFP